MRFSQSSLKRISLFLCITTVIYGPFATYLMAQDGGGSEGGEDPALQEFLEQQEQIFESLFGEPYNQEHWMYPLSEQVTGPGMYDGVNHLGQPFTLEVKHAVAIDLADPASGLSAAQAQA
ncbi:MAG: hypothetical protein L0219_03835, partial [Phycisphaerales bacterium]|nr:hypothetical protein [Phycisphaerales bacterium]